MILIAESGSTKTDWVLCNRDTEQSFQTVGLNPYYISSDDAIESLKEWLSTDLAATKIYFYGAGCSNESNRQKIRGVLTHFFPNSEISVYHDLIGAARAVSERNPSIVSILGTGSNSCLFDGQKITDQIDNLGFALGDEGSGGHIGKALIQARMYREMPAELQSKFDRQFSFDKNTMLDHVYHKPLPNRYVASYATFAGANAQHTFIKTLVDQCFDLFISRHLIKYNQPDLPCHFIGSIAAVFASQLKLAVERHGLTPGNIAHKPIHGLVKYHRDQDGL